MNETKDHEIAKLKIAVADNSQKFKLVMVTDKGLETVGQYGNGSTKSITNKQENLQKSMQNLKYLKNPYKDNFETDRKQ